MKKDFNKIPLSVLDLAVILEGKTPAESFQNSLNLAQHVEKLGYLRFWLAEHHNMASIASSATSVLIGHIAGGTSTIRVGSGGIMLPNHAPLVIAEQFGTLASLYPHRIDLGLGRAPKAPDWQLHLVCPMLLQVILHHRNYVRLLMSTGRPLCLRSNWKSPMQ